MMIWNSVVTSSNLFAEAVGFDDDYALYILIRKALCALLTLLSIRSCPRTPRKFNPNGFNSNRFDNALTDETSVELASRQSAFFD